MILRIDQIKSPGDLPNERIVIDVLEDGEIGSYLVFSALADNKSFYGGTGRGHWLAGQKVKKGDTVVLYSKKGSAKKKKLESGTTTYFYYWGSAETLWLARGRAAVLMKLDQWKACRVGGFDSTDDVEPEGE